MTDYLFDDPIDREEADARKALVMTRVRRGNPVSFAAVTWAGAGEVVRDRAGKRIYAMIATSRNEVEIQGPFPNAAQAADYVNGCDFDAMIFWLDEAAAQEWDDTDDKYIMVRIVGAVN